MSFTDPTAEPVQPDDGQGGQGTSDAPYSEYLNRIPEQVRGEVEPVFRDWDANTTRKFQEHAQYRDTWKPYEEVGVQNLQPDELKNLIEFQQGLAANPAGSWESMQGWARENGLLNDPQPGQVPDEEPWVDPQVQALQQELQELKAGYGDISQWRQQQEEASRQQQLASSLEAAYADLKAKHGDEFNAERVDDLIPKHWDPNVPPAQIVEKAFADWQAIRNQIATEALQAKVDQPPPAEAGGSAASAADPARSLEAAGKQALEMLRGTKSM